MRTLLLVLFVSLCAADGARAQLRFGADPIPFQTGLANGVVAFDFDVAGTQVLLRSITPSNPDLQAVVMAPGSGGWTLRLARSLPGAPQWMSVSMDGSVGASPGVTPGTLSQFRLLGVRHLEPGQQFQAAWRGRITWDGAASDFIVQTTWQLLPGQVFGRTGITVQLLESGPLPWHLARVLHPQVEVSAFPGVQDTLLVPFVTGNLIHDPTAPQHPFPTWLDREGNYYPVSVAAYSDGLPLHPTSFVFTAELGDDHWKDLLISAAPDGAADTQPGRIGFAFSHLPENLFATRRYATPYSVYLGVIEGDWWAVADAYRDRLPLGAPWYHGPVGSPANPMPRAVKELVAEVFFQPGFSGDHMDMLNLQMMNLQRVLGSQVSTVWYMWHAPDSFSHFLEQGYLPARPSLGGAVREAQKQFGHKASLYYNSGMGVDYTDPSYDPPITDPTPLQQSVHDSLLIQEDGEPLLLVSPSGPPNMGYLCPGADWWQPFMTADILDVAEFSDMQGVYLDVFLTGACFSTEHGHLPGGGNWMNTTRMAQLAALRQGLADLAPPPDDFVMSMEFLVGRFSEEVHVMHHDPANNLLSADPPGTPGALPLDNAVTIPFFRAVYDNVKLSRITTAVPDVTGRRAWVTANNVFTFGMLPDLTRPAPELIPLFSQRFAIAPYFSFPTIVSDANPFLNGGGAADVGGDPGGDVAAGDATPGAPGTLPGGIFTTPHANAFNTPYYNYLGSITTALRGDIPTLGSGQFAFRIWHNGTVRPLPPYTITQAGGPAFDGVPGVERAPDPTTPYTMTPVYTEQYPAVSPDPFPDAIGPELVPGMFRAPLDLGTADAGSLAFVATNPWVDPTQSAPFQIQFAVTPADDAGWPGAPNAPFSVWRYDANGTAPQFLGTTTGTFAHTETLNAGAIVWWVFRP